MVAAEGAHEPRSIGSYSLRLYGGANPNAPYDDFIAGVIRPRDGMLEAVWLADVDGDGALDVVVVLRSVGTGGYLAADAFRLEGGALAHIGSVAGLPKDADPVHALTAARRARGTPGR